MAFLYCELITDHHNDVAQNKFHINITMICSRPYHALNLPQEIESTSLTE